MNDYLIAGIFVLGGALTANAQTSAQPYGNPQSTYPPVYPQYLPPYTPRDYYQRDNTLNRPGDFTRPSEQIRYQDAIEREQELLQGTYALVATEVNGRETPAYNPGDQLIIRGNRCIRVTNGQYQLSGTLQVVEPFGRVKKMIVTHSDGALRGVQFPTLYVQDGNMLRTIYDGRGNAPQYPTRMVTVPGDGLTVNVWQRIGQ